MKNPFKRSRNGDRKLELLRRADSHRDASHTIGGRQKPSKEPISLARVPTLEKPEDVALPSTK